jgi:hypothetical protein
MIRKLSTMKISRFSLAVGNWTISQSKRKIQNKILGFTFNPTLVTKNISIEKKYANKVCTEFNCAWNNVKNNLDLLMKHGVLSDEKSIF